MKLFFTPQAERQAAEMDSGGASTALELGTSSRESWPTLGR
jgi:hypothetical protein